MRRYNITVGAKTTVDGTVHTDFQRTAGADLREPLARVPATSRSHRGAGRHADRRPQGAQQCHQCRLRVTDIPSGIAQAIELTMASQRLPVDDGRAIGFGNNLMANLADLHQRMAFVLKAATQFEALLQPP